MHFKLDTEVIYKCKAWGEAIKVETKGGLKFTIICPKKSDFCIDFESRCPMDCYNNGICLEENKCHCFHGYSGKDCVKSINKSLGNLHQL